MKISALALVIVVTAGSGCGSDEVVIPASMKVSALESPSAQKNGPAENAFAVLAAGAKSGSTGAASFAVYSLAIPDSPAGHLAARQAALNIAPQASVRKNALMNSSTVETGNWSLTTDDVSEGEVFVDNTRNHLGSSVAEANLATDDKYITIGRDHAKKMFGQAFTSMSPYAYKVRKYFNAHSSGQGTQIDGVYQVAVAFNSTIDGVPVIGPGGKVSVDMTTDGSVVRHEGSLRHTRARVHLVRQQQDLVMPDAAEAAVNARLDARGVGRALYRVARREFGYFMHGRRSIQTVLVPHYGFFFEPLPGTMGKTIVEIEPATTDPSVLALIAADAQAETARKAALMADTDERAH